MFELLCVGKCESLCERVMVYLCVENVCLFVVNAFKLVGNVIHEQQDVKVT